MRFAGQSARADDVIVRFRTSITKNMSHDAALTAP
jgi:hypothetical protein